MYAWVTRPLLRSVFLLTVLLTVNAIAQEAIAGDRSIAYAAVTSPRWRLHNV